MKKRTKKSKINGNSLGASGFTLGILSILFAGWIGVIFAIVGFIFCLTQQKRKPTKIGKVGMILNIIGFALSFLFIFYLAPLLTEWMQNKLMFPSA